MVWKSGFGRMTVDESLNSFVVGVIPFGIKDLSG